jgi:hypothetical protein
MKNGTAKIEILMGKRTFISQILLNGQGVAKNGHAISLHRLL